MAAASKYAIGKLGSSVYEIHQVNVQATFSTLFPGHYAAGGTRGLVTYWPTQVVAGKQVPGPFFAFQIAMSLAAWIALEPPNAGGWW